MSLAEKTPIDWSKPDTTMTNLIKKLTNLKHTQAALRTGAQSGKLTNLTTSQDATVYAYKRTSGDDNVVVMLNFGDSDVEFTVPEGLPAGSYRDALGGKAVDFSASPTFTLPAYGAAVYVK